MDPFQMFLRRRRRSEDFQRFDRFTTIGWTKADWVQLRDELNALKAPHQQLSDTAHNLTEVLRWLEAPDYPFTAKTRITPDTVRDTLRYEDGAVAALNGYIVGAPQPFVEFLLAMPRPSFNVPDVRATWQCTQHLHLDETAAIGWAATGLFTNMFNRFNPPHEEDNIVAGVADWVDRFGQDAWLWVLAGFDLEEATDLVVAGGGLVPDRQQLRVMAALNGADLPAGI